MFLPNHISKPVGNATPGVVAELLIAPKEWFATIAKPAAPVGGLLPGAVIEDDHLFISPEHGFIRIAMTGQTGNITYSGTGDIDNRSVNAAYEGFTAGLNEEILRLMGWNFEGIVLSRDLKCDDVERYYQLGGACTSAYPGEHEFATGTEGGDGRKGTTLRFVSNMEVPLIYTGVVTLATFPIQS